MKIMEMSILTEGAKVPTKGSNEAAGWDLYAIDEQIILPLSRCVVPTGISIALPQNTVGLIWPRSGLAHKHGIDVLAGVIDSDYRGEISVILQNHSGVPVIIKSGDRIAQILIQPIVPVNLMLVSDLDDTTRGTGAFGSTGK